MFPATARRLIAGAVTVTGLLSLTLTANGADPAVADGRAAATVLSCIGQIDMNVVDTPGGTATGRGKLVCAEPGRPDLAAAIVISGSVTGGGARVTETRTSDTISFETGKESHLTMDRRFERSSDEIKGDAGSAGNGRVDSGEFAGAAARDKGVGSFVIGATGTTYSMDRLTLTLDR
ncbi:hypothetical protein [Streptomyces albireticuli]|uniref:Uncharacterized protein n=1 Tax=Streptomyces albireticuli TaxID=1940 RepID=A0A2A2DD82_9ACTN|nr:hypothetical protein [Streptomyces albireticuli]MCD9144967.1 hypothetical protein [Streptomyces albireticuli]MCD9164393.1 hypothetical protein [Streptomyces albireticuli]MCD9194104.1 hypothetical protein [Streptomyces albireticuli]PAU49396.1 hypothetical protein CK936_08050 [Streptomyces albireticuli]